MDESQKHYNKQKKTDTRLYSIQFLSHDVLEEANCRDRVKSMVGRAWEYEKGLTIQGHKETF